MTYKLEDVSVTTGTRGFSNIGAIREPVEAQSVANLFRGGITSSLRASVSYDSRNNRLFPTGGWYHNAFVEVADNFTLSENIFVRYGGFSRHYRPLVGPFILRLNGEFGVTTSRDPLGVPITERYLIGGIFDVRGFRPRSLGPKLRVSQPGDVGQPLGELPLGGNLQLIWNSEIEFPLFQRGRDFRGCVLRRRQRLQPGRSLLQRYLALFRHLGQVRPLFSLSRVFVPGPANLGRVRFSLDFSHWATAL